MKESADKKRLDNIAVFLSNLGFIQFQSNQAIYSHPLFPGEVFDFSAISDEPKYITEHMFKSIHAIGMYSKQCEIKAVLGLK